MQRFLAARQFLRSNGLNLAARAERSTPVCSSMHFRFLSSRRGFQTNNLSEGERGRQILYTHFKSLVAANKRNEEINKLIHLSHCSNFDRNEPSIAELIDIGLGLARGGSRYTHPFLATHWHQMINTGSSAPFVQTPNTPHALDSLSRAVDAFCFAGLCGVEVEEMVIEAFLREFQILSEMAGATASSSSLQDQYHNDTSSASTTASIVQLRQRGLESVWRWWLSSLQKQQQQHRTSLSAAGAPRNSSNGSSSARNSMDWIRLVMESRGTVSICRVCADSVNVSNFTAAVGEILLQKHKGGVEKSVAHDVEWQQNHIDPITGFHLDFCNVAKKICVDVVGSTHFLGDYGGDGDYTNIDAGLPLSLQIAKEAVRQSEQIINNMASSPSSSDSGTRKNKNRFILGGESLFKKRMLEEAGGWKVIVIPYYKWVRKQRAARRQWVLLEIEKILE